MVHHLVLLKFKAGVGEKQISELEALLDDLPNKIIEIHLYEFGRDLLHTERSYDFGLSALFANPEALERYQKHPRHRKVLERIGAICDDVVTVDFTGSELGSGKRGLDLWEKDPFKGLTG